MKKYLVYVMGIGYVLAGLNHFAHPDFYLKMLVGFLPFPEALNAISGAAEILVGIGVMIPQTRRFSAWALIALLIAIFPANINMAIHHQNWNFSQIALYLRLPIQFLLIWWAWLYTRKNSVQKQH
jgi:uncharacterized membrane protein